MKKSLTKSSIYTVLGLFLVWASPAATKAEEMGKSSVISIKPNDISIHPGGSGVVVGEDSNYYYVLTNNHVVCIHPDNPSPDYRPGSQCQPSSGIFYATSDSGLTRSTVEVLHNYKSSHDIDLALVRVPATSGAEVATLGDSNYIEQGSTVFPTGYLAQNHYEDVPALFTQSEGFIVSKLTQISDGYSFQYAAETGIGMSGGPVFDIDGRVIGIHGGGIDTPETRDSQILQDGQLAGFKAAIPINAFLRICAEANNCPPGLNIDDSDLSEDPEEKLRNPESARDFYAKGLQLHAQRQFVSAERQYSEAIRLNPNYSGAYRHRGLARISQRRYSDAVADWTKAIETGYAAAEVYHHRGLGYARMKDLSKAEADYRQALVLNPYYAPVHRAMGDLYFDADNFQAALEAYSNAVEIDPNYAEAYFNRATTANNMAREFYSQGDTDRARFFFQQAVADLDDALPLLLDAGKDSAYQQALAARRSIENNARRIGKTQVTTPVPARPEVPQQTVPNDIPTPSSAPIPSVEQGGL